MSSALRRGRVLLVVGLVLSSGWLGCSPSRPSCVYTVSPPSLSLPPAGGSNTIAVSAGSGCAWSASSSAGWLTITSGSSGTGNGTVAFSAAANGSSARSATLTVAGQAVAVAQEGLPAPTYSLTGRVTDAFIGPGLGISGALVSLSSGPGEGSASTDFAGNYTIDGLAAGAYSVTVAKPFYTTSVATVVIAGPTSLPVSLALDSPAPVSTSNLTGNWSGAGSYPNDPFRLSLIQDGSRLRGMYVDGNDASAQVSGTYGTPEFTLRVDFGDGVLYLECAVADAREVDGVQRTSALGNRPYAFKMRR